MYIYICIYMCINVGVAELSIYISERIKEDTSILC